MNLCILWAHLGKICIYLDVARVLSAQRGTGLLNVSSIFAQSLGQQALSSSTWLLLFLSLTALLMIALQSSISSLSLNS